VEAVPYSGWVKCSASNGHEVTMTLHAGGESAERRERFDALYRDHQAAILGYALRRTSQPEDAADVLAETFLVAWRRLDDLPRDAEGRLWLYGVARRVLANQRRGERRRNSLAVELAQDLAGSPISAEPIEDIQELAAAFRRLSKADRELLALEGWEDLDPGEIAVVLGCSRNAARIRLHRARRRLRSELARPSRYVSRPSPVSTRQETP
jgi:RNA polymerase sigma factor (sigma-70 family)